jgi:hypothetical protein
MNWQDGNDEEQAPTIQSKTKKRKNKMNIVIAFDNWFAFIFFFQILS